MGFIPHPPVPMEQVRPTDIWVLLWIGVAFEIATRTWAYVAKAKSPDERAMEISLIELQYETAQKRRLGQSAFVETSKLERAMLAKEKELNKIREERKKQTDHVAKINRNVGLMLYMMVFVLYFGIPILTIDGMRVVDPETTLLSTSAEHAANIMRATFFPVSYMGTGMKIARLGIPQSSASVGALVVLWSAQVTVGKIIDCVEVLLP